MFKGTRKAFERAPQFFSGSHHKDPDTAIWQKDFAAARAAVTIMERTIKETVVTQKAVLAGFSELLCSFSEWRNCDASGSHNAKIPDSTNALSPIFDAEKNINSLNATHQDWMVKKIQSARESIVKIEALLAKSDRKKMDSDKVTQAETFNPDDAQQAQAPEVALYLRYQNHVNDVVPKFLTQLDKVLQALAYKQIEQLILVENMFHAAIAQVSDSLQLVNVEGVQAILDEWNASVQPARSKLTSLRVLSGASVATSQSLAHIRTPSVKQVTGWGTDTVGGVTHGVVSGFHWLTDSQVKFHNPSKGMFAPKDESDYAIGVGKQVGTPTSPRIASPPTSPRVASPPTSPTSTKPVVSEPLVAEPVASHSKAGEEILRDVEAEKLEAEKAEHTEGLGGAHSEPAPARSLEESVAKSAVPVSVLPVPAEPLSEPPAEPHAEPLAAKSLSTEPLSEPVSEPISKPVSEPVSEPLEHAEPTTTPPPAPVSTEPVLDEPSTHALEKYPLTAPSSTPHVAELDPEPLASPEPESKESTVPPLTTEFPADKPGFEPPSDLLRDTPKPTDQELTPGQIEAANTIHKPLDKKDDSDRELL